MNQILDIANEHGNGSGIDTAPGMPTVNAMRVEMDMEMVMVTQMGTTRLVAMLIVMLVGWYS